MVDTFCTYFIKFKVRSGLKRISKVVSLKLKRFTKERKLKAK